MNIYLDIETMKEYMSLCAAVFGGSPWCGSARNYHSGWGYGVIAFEDSDFTYIEVTVSPGTGDMPCDPMQVAQELLGINDKVMAGLYSMEGYWGSEVHCGVRYTAMAPKWTTASRQLRKAIKKIARTYSRDV